MASKTLRSNLIITTKLPAPKTGGLKSVEKTLETISKLIDEINGKQVVIKVDLTGGSEAIASLKEVSNIATQNAKAAKRQASAAGKKAGRPPISGAPVPIAEGGDGGFYKKRTVITPGEEGENVSQKVSQIRRKGDLEFIDATTIDALTGEVQKIEQDIINESIDRQRKRAKQVAAKPDNIKNKLEDARAEFQGRVQAGQTFAREKEVEGFTARAPKTRSIPLIKEAPTQRVTAAYIEYFKVLKDGSEVVRGFDEATGRETPERINKNTDAYRKQKQEKYQLNRLDEKRQALQEQIARGNRIGTSLSQRNFTEQEPVKSAGPLVRGIPDENDITKVRSWTRVLADGSEQTVTFNELTNRARTTLNKNTQAYRDNAAVVKLQANETKAAADVQNLLSQGFVQHSQATKRVSIGNRDVTTTLTEMRKVSGNALTRDLAIEISRVNSATGEMTTKVIRGNEAMRAMGDSFTNAVAKVGLWFAAVSTIFLFTNAVGFATRQLKDLESNTILLARVGAGLGEGFTQRHAEAKLLTRGLVEQSIALGQNAVEAQRAATVFARTGQNRIQILESTRAALVAARIAELDVEEAAKLLSSAQTQFNLRSNELLPTLDSLNSLSNKYRVTTNDLLQAISRSGSVYAAANGTLEQLGATVAVVAERTTRSGSEIGNAIKTIQSRLAAPETSSALIQQTGIALSDAAGNAKNFNQILLELRNAMVNLTQAERQNLLVTIAGARQVNILQNAVNGIIDIVIAESRALRDSNSALTESVDSSATLEAALGRLQGQFTQLAYTSGGSLNALLTQMTQTITVILQLAGSFDGLLIKLGLAALAFIVIKTAIASYAKSNLAAAGSAYLMTTAMAGQAAAATVAGRAITFLDLAMKRLNVTAAVVTAGIGLIVYAFSTYESSVAKASIAGRENIDALSSATTAAERQFRSTLSLVSALDQEIEAQKKLNQARREGKEVPESALKSRLENIRKLQEELKIVSTGNVDVDDDLLKSQQEARAKLKKDTIASAAATKEELEAAQKVAKANGDQADAKRKDIAATKESIAVLKARLEDVKKRPDFLGKGDIIGSLSSRIEKEETNLTQQQTEFNELSKAANEARTRVIDLKDALRTLEETKVPSDLTEKTRKAIDAGREAVNIGKSEEKLAKGRQNFTGIGILDDAANAEAQAAQKRRREKAFVAVAGVSTTTREFELYAKEVINATEALEKLEYQAAKTRIDKVTKSVRGALDDESEIFQGLSNQRGALDFVANRDALGGEQFEKFAETQTKIKSLRKELLANLVSLRSVSAIPAKAFGGPEEKLGAAEALRAKASDLAQEARAAEVQLAKDLLAIELDIAKQKKKQNEETAKALGLLGDEDKIRLLSQAQYFRQNPNAKISVADQFFASSETNKLNQDFFGKYLQHGLDEAQPFDKFLLGAGIGPYDEGLDHAQRRLKNTYDNAGGRDKFYRDRVDSAGENRAMQDRLEGRTPTIWRGGQTTVDLAINTPLTVLPPETFTPLIDAFRGAITTELVATRDELVKQVQEIWDVVEANPDIKRQLPGRAPETP